MKIATFNLRIPGPTPLPEEVLKPVSRQMINHRGKKYEKMQSRIVDNLKYFFATKNDIFLLTSSGMGGLEASIVNFFSPGDTLVFFTCGEFGNRWAEIGQRFGTKVIHIKFPVGLPVDKNEIRRVLEKNTNIKGVFITHNETATGIINNIAELTPIVHKHKNKPLVLIDSISALGAVDLPMDKLGIDVLVTASQKAWMAPPGIAMIAVSPRAWDRHKYAKMPRYYFDLSLFKEFSLKNQTPATPAVATLYGLDRSLQTMRKVSKEQIFNKHLMLRDYLRKKINNLGLKLFVAEICASPTVTSIVIPSGIDSHQWLDLLNKKYHQVLAGGMGETKGKIIRIAHLGFVTVKEIDQVITALSSSLKDLQPKKK